MRWTRLAIAAVLLVVGLLWVAQGTGTVSGGAMSGQAMWSIVGGVLVVAGLVMVFRELMRRPVGR
jgi:hypothetical protein